MTKKSKKPKKSELKIDLLQNLEDRLKEIYKRNNGTNIFKTIEEKKEVEQIKEEINKLKNK
jgi:adenylate kinase family enzyme|tara:strand:+ start:520 stop:702 length:183 start_codon:yes stop_codon:yes gene_type:complete